MATQDYSNGVTLTDAAEFERFDCVAYSVLSGVAGTNTITATGPATYTLAATRPPVWFIPAATNTGATTINVTPSGGVALGAKNVFFNGAACVGGELRANVPAALIYDGTQFHIVANAFTAPLTLSTEQATTSGTSIDFTSIPSWVKRITVQFVGVSTSGTSNLIAQIGDAGGIEDSGYLGTGVILSNASAVSTTAFTAGYGITAAVAAGTVIHGTVTLSLEDAANFTWVATAILSGSDNAQVLVATGSKSLSAALDRVRITTASGSDTFDAGAINILFS